jgi:hypothetical protein
MISPKSLMPFSFLSLTWSITLSELKSEPQ